MENSGGFGGPKLDVSDEVSRPERDMRDLRPHGG